MKSVVRDLNHFGIFFFPKNLWVFPLKWVIRNDFFFFFDELGKALSIQKSNDIDILMVSTFNNHFKVKLSVIVRLHATPCNDSL
jgi:hypothetical protein